LSFWAVLVVLWGPILGTGAGGILAGAPELFLLRSLLFNVESMGCPPWVVAPWPEAEALCEIDRDGGFGLVDVTVGLNVTVR
jgi:hypothetical protein